MNAGRPTDVLLWRVRLNRGAPSPRRVSLPGELRVSRLAWSPSESLLYVYAPLARRESMAADELARLQLACSLEGGPTAAVELCRLQRILDLPGASADEAPLAHYVVETDADEGWMDEIARWYEVEHLPGLAAVPGCIRAMRFVNHDGGPASLACYDLTRADVLETPAWLSVRASEWSGRTRPHFTNTRRTRFDVLSMENL